MIALHPLRMTVVRLLTEPPGKMRAEPHNLRRFSPFTVTSSKFPHSLSQLLIEKRTSIYYIIVPWIVFVVNLFFAFFRHLWRNAKNY